MDLVVRGNNVLTAEVITKVKEYFGIKRLPDEWKNNLEENSFDGLGKIGKMIHFSNLPQSILNIFDKLNIATTTKFSTTLENLTEGLGLDADGVIEVFGKESIVHECYKRNTRNRKPSSLNPQKTLINITNKSLIEALNNQKILYHIATIPVEDDIKEHIDAKTYEELFGSLFEEPIFEGYIVLEANNVKSYIGYY